MAEIIRGLSFGGVVPVSEVGVFEVAERTELAVATLGSLGLVTDKAEAADHIGQQMQRLHDTLTSAHPEAGVEPFFAIELSERFGLNALVKAFDAKQTASTYVYDSLWNQYSAAELNSRRGGAKSVAAPNEGLSGAARAMLLGGDNAYNKVGLYHIDKDLKSQRKAVRQRELVNPADYVILNAQRREAGAPLLDRQTFSRFVQLEMKRAAGDLWVPRASAGGGRLALRRSGGRAISCVGVRFSVGPEVSEL